LVYARARRDSGVLNNPPIKAVGLGGQNIVYEPRGRDTSDHFTVVYEYPGKVHVTFSIIKYGAFDVDGSFTRVYGEKGVCEMSGKFIGREKGAQPRQLDMQRGDSTAAWRDHFQRLFQNYL